MASLLGVLLFAFYAGFCTKEITMRINYWRDTKIVHRQLWLFVVAWLNTAAAAALLAWDVGYQLSKVCKP